jgi:hypothetical protein
VPFRPQLSLSPYGLSSSYLRSAFPEPDRDRHAYVAPLIATLLGGPLMLIGLLVACASPMATDPCTPGGCHDLNRMLLIIPCVLGLGLVALVLAWVLPWRLDMRAYRCVAAVAAPLLALTTLLLYLDLPAAN